MSLPSRAALQLASEIAPEAGSAFIFGARFHKPGQWFVHCDGVEFDGCDLETVRAVGRRLTVVPNEVEYRKALAKAERMRAIVEGS